MRCIDSVKEAIGMSPQERSRAVEDKTLCTSHIHSRLGVRANAKAGNTREKIYCMLYLYNSIHNFFIFIFCCIINSIFQFEQSYLCLLYTSDAADEGVEV